MKYHNIPTLFDNQASLINGKNIGTDSVRYIQDAGQKTAGTTYIDKNTNELYVCVTTTNSVNNDGNFSKFNLKEAFNKLDSFALENPDLFNLNQKIFNREMAMSWNKAIPSLADVEVNKWITWQNTIKENGDFYTPMISFDYKFKTGYGTTYVVDIKNIKIKFKNNDWQLFYNPKANFVIITNVNTELDTTLDFNINPDNTIQSIYDFSNINLSPSSYNGTKAKYMDVRYTLELKYKNGWKD